MIHELGMSDLRHEWFEDPDGFMVSDWEMVGQVVSFSGADVWP